MKTTFTALAVLLLLAVTPSFGQTKLLTARTYAFLDFVTGATVLGDSSLFDYYSNHKTKEIKTWHYDGAVWAVTDRLTDYTYNASGNILSYTDQVGNDIIGWTNSARYTFTYDANDQLLTYLNESWNGSAWAPSFSAIWEYDANGNVVRETRDNLRYLYSYNAEGLLETVLDQQLDAGIWNNQKQNVYSYAPGDTKVASITTNNWNGGAWETYSRSSYTYDGNGDEAIELEELWAGTAWESLQRQVNTYDANHNNIYWIVQFYNSGIWEDYLRSVSTYDSESNILNVNWDVWLGTEWATQNLFHHYYGEFVSTGAPRTANFQLFPNPTTGAVTLQGENLAQAQVFDQQGRLVRSIALNGLERSTLQTGNLAPGNYLIQVQGANGEMGSKLLQVRR